MRKALLLSPLLLMACATRSAPPPPPAPTPPPLHGASSGHVCRNDGLDVFVGRQATAALGAEILRLSGAGRLRWVSPGMMVTMEYRADRVTVSLAPGNVVARVGCG